MLPRIIGQGRAAELLYTGRVMRAEEGERWGFWNALHVPDNLDDAAITLARQLVAGPTFAHGITKTQLNQEWNMSLEQAIEAEAQAQALCMQTEDSPAPIAPSWRRKSRFRGQLRCPIALSSPGHF